MSTAFNWKTAWEEHGPDSPWPGLEYYPQMDAPSIYEGDKYWDTERNVVVTIKSVRTKVYKGVVGGHGEEGHDCVFFETDESKDLSHARHGRQPPEPPSFISVEEFNERVESGEWQPHTDNGHPPLPP